MDQRRWNQPGFSELWNQAAAQNVHIHTVTEHLKEKIIRIHRR